MGHAEGMPNIHHVYIWRLNEHKNAFEAYVIINDFCDTETVKIALKVELEQGFNITHSTLEFEIKHCKKSCC